MIRTDPRHALGSVAESAVCENLRTRGFDVIERNWRRPWGELDIIATHRGVIHFIEVKASAGERTGFEASRRADTAKMRKVLRTARSWLAERSMSPETAWQLDIVEVSIHGPSGHMRHFLNVSVP